MRHFAWLKGALSLEESTTVKSCCCEEGESLTQREGIENKRKNNKHSKCESKKAPGCARCMEDAKYTDCSEAKFYCIETKKSRGGENRVLILPFESLISPRSIVCKRYNDVFRSAVETFSSLPKNHTYNCNFPIPSPFSLASESPPLLFPLTSHSSFQRGGIDQGITATVGIGGKRLRKGVRKVA